MKLIRLRVKDFRGIADGELHLTAGVTVLVGPNETGKSSLAEALRLLLEVKSDSKAAAVKAVKPKGRDAGPWVEAELQIGPYQLIYRKRFLKANLTELLIQKPTREQISGREAHQKVETILAEHLDRELWRAMQIRQGDGLQALPLAQIPSLIQLLDRGSGSTGAAGDPIWNRAEKVYSTFFTEKTGRERGKGPELRRSLQEAQEKRTELRQSLGAWEQDEERFQELQQEIQRKQDHLPELQESCRRHRQNLQALQQLEARLEKAVNESERAQAELQAQAGLHERRLELCQEVEQAQREWEQLQQAEQAAELEDRPILQADAEAAEAWKQAKQRTEQCRLQLRFHQQVLEEIRRQARIEACQRALSERAELRRQEQERLADLERLAVSEEELQNLQKKSLACLQAQTRVEQKRLKLQFLAEQDLELQAGDQALVLKAGEPWQWEGAEDLELAHPGVWRLQIQLGEETRRAEQEARQAQSQLESALKELGVVSLEEAQRQRAAFLALQQASEADRDRRQELEKGLPPEPELSLERWRLQSESWRQSCTSIPDPLPEEATAEAALQQAKDEEEEASQSEKRAEQVWQEGRRRRDQAMEEALNRQGRLKERESQWRTRRESLKLARERQSDEALQLAVQTAQAELQALEQTVQGLKTERRGTDPDWLRSQAENAESSLQGAQGELQDLAHEQSRLAGHLEARQRAGLHQAWQQAEADVEALKTQLQDWLHQAGAAQRLWQCLNDYRNQARAAYQRPLQQRLEALGRRLFGPDFAVELDQELRIQRRYLQGRSLPWDSLSAGAREQLGLLVRLAVASLVAADEGVPLILDDVLGYTDPTRLESLSAILAAAGAESQILILSCDPERYRFLGAAKLLRWQEQLSQGSSQSKEATG